MTTLLTIPGRTTAPPYVESQAVQMMEVSPGTPSTIYLHQNATALQIIADHLQNLLTHNTMLDGQILCNI